MIEKVTYIILQGRKIEFSVKRFPKISRDGRVARFFGFWYQRFDGTKFTCADPAGRLLGWKLDIYFRPLERQFEVDATYPNPDWVPGQQKFTNLQRSQTQTSPL